MNMTLFFHLDMMLCNWVLAMYYSTLAEDIYATFLTMYMCVTGMMVGDIFMTCQDMTQTSCGVAGECLNSQKRRNISRHCVTKSDIWSSTAMCKKKHYMKVGVIQIISYTCYKESDCALEAPCSSLLLVVLNSQL